MNKSVTYHFLKSVLTLENPFLSTADFMDWLQEKKNKVKHSITPIPFAELENWSFHPVTGNLVHDSGQFFTIEGIKIKTNWGVVANWNQPIINQLEIGFLGIICKKFDGILYFLMQAKIEPGNINVVQLSPTLQATKSNYTQVHKGKTPLYFDYFFDKRADVTILLDQLQSEQGARFLKKRNRNIIIEVINDIEVKEDFCWLTLGQIKQLLTFDNVVNMDTRTVISGIPYGNLDTLEVIKNVKQNSYERALLISELDPNNALHSVEDIISWITKHKVYAELEVEKIPLNNLTDWGKNEDSIYHVAHKYFSVIAVKAEIENREVHSWTQPMIKSAQEGIIAFIIKKINGVYHFLIQAKLESGNFDIIELAPTVQCLTGNYRKGFNEYEVNFIDYALYPEQNNAEVRYSTFQSEEGGRFYQEQNKNMIIEVGDDFREDVPNAYIWMTLNQLKTFIKFNNYLNVQARSLLSAVKFV
ncbi:MAG: NDP-hexose 2,3-dehydratase [Flavobacteriales bacterium CG_4_10_14_0_2_um_filter_32_8]|nr:MAG: NDP-hexose 2,3-dehydratase [Flavobacteriales bacterium CG_4_10_14_0_2_um_filter_32_8]